MHSLQPLAGTEFPEDGSRKSIQDIERSEETFALRYLIISFNSEPDGTFSMNTRWGLRVGKMIG